jgi:hypothetical protein
MVAPMLDAVVYKKTFPVHFKWTLGPDAVLVAPRARRIPAYAKPSAEGSGEQEQEDHFSGCCGMRAAEGLGRQIDLLKGPCAPRWANDAGRAAQPAPRWIQPARFDNLNGLNVDYSKHE